MATSIRLGISQLAWGYDLSRPDGWLRFLDEASEIGYEGILAFDSTLPFASDSRPPKTTYFMFGIVTVPS